MNNSLFNLVDTICELMDRAGIVYAITGSLASSAHGEVYASVDVDVCLFASSSALDAFLRSLPSRFYHDDDAIRDAAIRESIINITDNQTGWKVDLSFLPREGYLAGVLSRRKKVRYGLEGKLYWTVSAEDIVLMKLLWRKETRSQKQWENALSVARIQGVRLDWAFLHHWADQLGMREDLERLKREAGI